MSITLTHVSGPLASQKQTFDDSVERIVLGRDPSLCTVVYPADLTLVGREHCALVRKLSGDYNLELFGEHFVAVDGEPALPDAGLRSGATIALGKLDGPKFTVSIDRATVSPGLERTSIQQKPASIYANTKRAKQLAIGAVLLAIIGIAGFAWELRNSEIEKQQRLATIQELATLKAEAAAGRVSPAIQKHLASSVYAVVTRNSAGAESLLGTAWAIDENTLATNAHVAVERNNLQDGETLLVKPSGSANVENVVNAVTIHPGYKAFDHYLGEDAFIVEGTNRPSRYDTIPGYDVALLHVDGQIPPENIFEIADGMTLWQLSPGQPLAYAGYPYENIQGGDIQAIGRTPQLQMGNLTALTDYFLLPAAADQRRLVLFNLPAAGGASGSPVVNADGKVIGLLSDINLTSVNNERLPSGAEINYAQRVDALVELRDGQADKRVEADLPYWHKQTSNFKGGADFIIADALQESQPKDGSKSVLVSNNDYDMTKADESKTDKDGMMRFKFIPMTLAPNTKHFIIAYGKGLTPITALGIAENGKVVSKTSGDGAPYAALTVDAPADGKVTVVVETGDKGVRFILRDYLWQKAPAATN